MKARTRPMSRYACEKVPNDAVYAGKIQRTRRWFPMVSGQRMPDSVFKRLGLATPEFIACRSLGRHCVPQFADYISTECAGPLRGPQRFIPVHESSQYRIIAHVDHGKTTLVDRLLQQSGSFRDNQRVAERALDFNELERERGITILAKVTSVVWKGTRINIVDTPGHADFGGEVERILNMVDGAIVLVDAAEGPLPQTKFVVSKALKTGLRPIVVINKVDRPDARAMQVLDEVFDLFVALEATDEQLDFPVIYGSAKEGWMARSLGGPKQSTAPLLDLVLERVPPPKVEQGPFRMLGTILEADPYLGRLVTGRITSGSVKPNQMVKVLDRTGKLVEQGRIIKLLAFRGLERTAIEEAEAGDIVAVA